MGVAKPKQEEMIVSCKPTYQARRESPWSYFVHRAAALRVSWWRGGTSHPVAIISAPSLATPAA